MAKLAAIKSLQIPFRAEIGGVVVAGKFQPSVLNDSLIEEMKEKEREAKAEAKRKKAEVDIPSFTAFTLERVITEWDIEGDDGKTCLVTAEFLTRELGYWGTNLIYQAITEAMNPNASSGEDR